MAFARADAADAVAQVDAIKSAGALHRPVMHRKHHRVALTQRHHLGTRLHARPLLGQHELAAGEIAARLRQQDRDLQRKHMLAVEVLMQAVVVAGAVLQQQRRRPGLAGGVAALQESVVACPGYRMSMPIASFQRLAMPEAARTAPDATPRSGPAADRKNICTRRAQNRGGPSRRGCGNERRRDRARPARGIPAAWSSVRSPRSPVRRVRR